jgi:uncharacterized protein (TIGR03067 family)
MKWNIILPLVASVAIAAEASAQTEPTSGDRDKLQGTWIFVKELKDGKEMTPAEVRELYPEPYKRILFKGDDCFVELERDEDTTVIIRGAFTLEGSDKGKTLQVSRKSKKKEDDYKCPYSLEGDDLRLFEDAHLTHILKRQK